MNIKDLLASEGRLEFRIQRNTKTLLERYAQHEARMEVAEAERDRIRGCHLWARKTLGPACATGG